MAGKTSGSIFHAANDRANVQIGVEALAGFGQCESGATTRLKARLLLVQIGVEALAGFGQCESVAMTRLKARLRVVSRHLPG